MLLNYLIFESMKRREDEGVEFRVSNLGGLHEALSRLRKSKGRAPMDRCLWWHADCENPIGSHSLSECWLRAVSDEGKSIVLRLNASKAGKEPVKIVSELDGVSRISVFKGFCSTHDNKIFNPIDRLDFEATKENCCLATYRSVCHAVASKYAVASTYLQTPNVLKSESPSELDKVAIKTMRECIDLMALKQQYEAWMNREIATEPIEHKFAFIEPRLPFCGSVTFLPCVTPTGRMLDVDQTWMSIVVLPWKSGSLVIFAIDRKSPKNGSLVVKMFNSIPQVWKADILFKYMIECGENIAIAPKWWFELREGVRNDILNRSFRNVRTSSTAPSNLFLQRGVPLTPCRHTIQGSAA